MGHALTVIQARRELLCAYPEMCPTFVTDNYMDVLAQLQGLCFHMEMADARLVDSDDSEHYAEDPPPIDAKREAGLRKLASQGYPPPIETTTSPDAGWRLLVPDGDDICQKAEGNLMVLLLAWRIHELVKAIHAHSARIKGKDDIKNMHVMRCLVTVLDAHVPLCSYFEDNANILDSVEPNDLLRLHLLPEQQVSTNAQLPALESMPVYIECALRAWMRNEDKKMLSLLSPIEQMLHHIFSKCGFQKCQIKCVVQSCAGVISTKRDTILPLLSRITRCVQTQNHPYFDPVYFGKDEFFFRSRLYIARQSDEDIDSNFATNVKLLAIMRFYLLAHSPPGSSLFHAIRLAGSPEYNMQGLFDECMHNATAIFRYSEGRTELGLPVVAPRDVVLPNVTASVGVFRPAWTSKWAFLADKIRVPSSPYVTALYEQWRKQRSATNSTAVRHYRRKRKLTEQASNVPRQMLELPAHPSVEDLLHLGFSLSEVDFINQVDHETKVPFKLVDESKVARKGGSAEKPKRSKKKAKGARAKRRRCGAKTQDAQSSAQPQLQGAAAAASAEAVSDSEPEDDDPDACHMTEQALRMHMKKFSSLSVARLKLLAQHMHRKTSVYFVEQEQAVLYEDTFVYSHLTARSASRCHRFPKSYITLCHRCGTVGTVPIGHMRYNASLSRNRPETVVGKEVNKNVNIRLITDPITRETRPHCAHCDMKPCLYLDITGLVLFARVNSRDATLTGIFACPDCTRQCVFSPENIVGVGPVCGACAEKRRQADLTPVRCYTGHALAPCEIRTRFYAHDEEGTVRAYVSCWFDYIAALDSGEVCNIETLRAMHQFDASQINIEETEKHIVSLKSLL